MNIPPTKENEIDTTFSKMALIVEDEERLLKHLMDILQEEGFKVYPCGSYIELDSILEMSISHFDLIVLDRLLQGKDSGSLLGKIKSTFSRSKVLILSAINTPSEKAQMLDHGADDYLAKPFDSEELIARIRAILRRNYHTDVFGDLSLNSIARSMRINDQDVVLTNKEFDLLKIFLKAPGKIFNKAFINSQVWEMSAEVDSNAIETTITKIRKKLAEANSIVKIRNIRNRGYWIEK